jgi:hypothetical protein
VRKGTQHQVMLTEAHPCISYHAPQQMNHKFETVTAKRAPVEHLHAAASRRAGYYVCPSSDALKPCLVVSSTSCDGVRVTPLRPVTTGCTAEPLRCVGNQAPSQGPHSVGAAP